MESDRKNLVVKIYLVMLGSALPHVPHRIIDVKLSYGSAKAIVDKVPSAYIVKMYADKRYLDDEQVSILLKGGRLHGTNRSNS